MTATAPATAPTISDAAAAASLYARRATQAAEFNQEALEHAVRATSDSTDAAKNSGVQNPFYAAMHHYDAAVLHDRAAAVHENLPGEENKVAAEAHRKAAEMHRRASGQHLVTVQEKRAAKNGPIVAVLYGKAKDPEENYLDMSHARGGKNFIRNSGKPGEHTSYLAEHDRHVPTRELHVSHDSVAAREGEHPWYVSHGSGDDEIPVDGPFPTEGHAKAQLERRKSGPSSTEIQEIKAMEEPTHLASVEAHAASSPIMDKTPSWLVAQLTQGSNDYGYHGAAYDCSKCDDCVGAMVNHDKQAALHDTLAKMMRNGIMAGGDSTAGQHEAAADLHRKACVGHCKDAFPNTRSQGGLDGSM